MGAAKHAMIEREENLSRATGYLARKGYLERCDHHGEVWDAGMELDKDFYRMAMGDRNRGSDGPIPWAADLDAREFTDLLNQALEEHCGDGCGYCEKNERD